MQNRLSELKKLLESLKTEIDQDDERFRKVIKYAEEVELMRLKSNHAPVHIFASQMQKQISVDKQFELAVHRHGLYNRLVQLIARYIVANLTEMIYTNKGNFRSVFCSPKSDT